MKQWTETNKGENQPRTKEKIPDSESNSLVEELSSRNCECSKAGDFLLEQEVGEDNFKVDLAFHPFNLEPRDDGQAQDDDDDDDGDDDGDGDDDMNKAKTIARIVSPKTKALHRAVPNKRQQQGGGLLDYRQASVARDSSSEGLGIHFGQDRLVWGSSKPLPVGYGIKKLQIQWVAEDDKVGTDMLEEKITAFEDYVLSMECGSFQQNVSGDSFWNKTIAAGKRRTVSKDWNTLHRITELEGTLEVF
ncbi:elongation factor 1-beta-like [Erythrolamprus reginae]|uniref:elongation factor 1-beta-like n=1 Tax=Erythrolamprus reginae TaxID=121349 RepID=UPI00396C9555